MRILITNERLDQRPGSDLFVRDLARGMQRLGHFVIAYSSDQRHLVRLLERDSISVATDLENLPFRPDVIHSRHHLDAMTALLALPGVPVVHHCLDSAWSTALPRHPRIHRYIAPSPVVASRIADAGVSRGHVELVANGVDLARFARVRDAPPVLRNAAVYDDLLDSGDPLISAIREATTGLGLRLDLIGRRFGLTIDNPELRLLDYDIVFAGGRKALEAMACGCAVIVTGSGTCGGIVAPETLEAVRSDDCLPAANAPPATVDGIRSRLERYAAKNAQAVTAEVRRSAGFAGVVKRIEAVYLAAIAANEASRPDWDAEQMALSRYVHNLSVMIKEMDRRQKENGDMALATASLFLDVSANLSAIQADLDRPHWWPDQRPS